MLYKLRQLDHHFYRTIRHPVKSPLSDKLITAVYLTAAVGLIAGRRERVIASGIAITSSEACKRLFSRRRPYERYGHLRPSRDWSRSSSFPSSHSAAAFAAALADPSASHLLLATTLASSRVPGGQHYPADVISGALLGSFVGLIVYSCQKKK